MYDSTQDTLQHIKRVSELLNLFSIQLLKRSIKHDKSKLENPEKKIFDKMTPKLKKLTYGSDEYKESLQQLGVALTHHYENNSHHPEHYENGIEGMDLFDLIEMFLDWKAASERHSDGRFEESLNINAERFKINSQLMSIFKNTKGIF